MNTRTLAATITVLWFMVGATSAQAPIGGEHSGRYLLNPSPPDSNAFINQMKGCANWQTIGTFAYPNILNSDGYPQQAPAVPLKCNVRIIDQGPGAYAGNWILSWEGNLGTGGKAGLQITGSRFGGFNVISDPGHCVASRSNGLQLTSSNCSVTFSASPSSTNGHLILTFLPNSSMTGVTKLDLYRADRKTNHERGDIFDPDYLTYLRAINPKIIRFLDWSYISFGNRSKFYNETPTTAASYLVDYWDKNAWVGTLDNPGCGSIDGITYTAPAPKTWSGLADGAIVQCEIGTTNGNTRATLNVGGSGAIPIVLSQQSRPVTVGSIVQHKLVTFTYSKQLNQWFLSTSFNGGLTYAIPTSVEVALCNLLQKDCWFQIPTQFDVESAQEMAIYVANNLKKPNKAYFEYSNEIFLSFSSQGVYALNMGNAIGFPKSDFFYRPQYDFYGLRTKQFLDAIKAVWPKGDDRLNGVSTNQIIFQTFFKKYKLDGEDLTLDANGRYCSGAGCTIVTNYSTKGSRPIDSITTISYGSYYGPPNMMANSSLPTLVNAPCFTFSVHCPYTALEETAANIGNISNSTPPVITVSGGNVASWKNGDRIQLTGSFGIPSLTSAWTTVQNLTSLGGGKYSFTLSSEPPTTDNAGKTISIGSYEGYSGGGKATRVVPGLNDSLLEAAADHAKGNSASAFAWLLNDTIKGTRISNRGGDLNINNYEKLWMPATEVVAASYPNLQVIMYEGGFQSHPMSAINGATLGLKPAQVTQISELLDAFKHSDHFQKAVNLWLQAFMALPHSRYPAQYQDLGITTWAITPGNIYNYASGSGSYSSFGAIAKFNNAQ